MPIDILSMLGTLKGKVLDAANYDTLFRAYEMQNNNIEQLKINNEALKESNDLLKLRIGTLEGEAKTAKADLEALQKSLPDAPSEYKPQGLAQRIMQVYKQSGNTDHTETEFKRQLRCSDIEFSAAMRELQEKKILRNNSSNPIDGMNYVLTPDGEQLVLRGN